VRQCVCVCMCACGRKGIYELPCSLCLSLYVCVVTEECDCGSNNCTLSDDRCCDGASCTLLESAQCSSGDACCNSCKFSPKGLLCRPVFGDCDIEEKCTGNDASCPPDQVKGPGTECLDNRYGEGTCYSGECLSMSSACEQNTANMVEGPFTACEKLEEFTNNVCGDMYCMEADTNNKDVCNIFVDYSIQENLDGKLKVQVPTGVPCSEDRQCFNGQCVDSSLLSPKLFWQIGNWEEDCECDTLQFRSVDCLEEDNKGIWTEVDQRRCSPQNRPPANQLCVNTERQCVNSVHDTQLDVFVRNLAGRYGAAEGSKIIKAVIPRACGPETPSLTDDDLQAEYLSCLYLLVLPGLFFAMLGVGFAMSYRFCRTSVWEQVFNTTKPHGYTPRERNTPFIVAIVLLVIVLLAAAVGMFYNGEVRRAITDPSIGVTLTLSSFLNRALDKAALLSKPIQVYTANSTHSNLTVALAKIESVQEDVFDDASVILLDLESLGITWDGQRESTEKGDAFYTTANSTFVCVPCDGLIGRVTAVSAQIDAQMTRVYREMQLTVVDTQQSLQMLMRDVRGRSSPFATAAINFDATVTFLETTEENVDLFFKDIKGMEAVRHPSVFAFFGLPFVVFILVLLAKVLQREKLYSYALRLSFLMMLVSWVSFGIHMPLALVFSDLCDLMKLIEKDVSTNLDAQGQVGVFVDTCLSPERSNLMHKKSLDLEDQFAFMRGLNFDKVPTDNREMFTVPLLRQLVRDVEVMKRRDWGYSGVSDATFESNIRDLNIIINPATNYTTANYTDLYALDPGTESDPGLRQEIRQKKWDAISLGAAQEGIEERITQVRAMWRMV
jgi:hypothetical protein